MIAAVMIVCLIWVPGDVCRRDPDAEIGVKYIFFADEPGHPGSAIRKCYAEKGHELRYYKERKLGQRTVGGAAECKDLASHEGRQGAVR